MELQQSPTYKKYIQSLGWKTTDLDGSTIFIRHIPLIGTLAKIQRVDSLPAVFSCIATLKHLGVKTVALEPSPKVLQSELTPYVKQLKNSGFRVNSSPFIPTKTIRIDIHKPQEKIFHAFSEAKRRAVRRAEKHGVTASESDNIDMLIKTKNRSAGLFGFITTHGVKELWQAFAPENATTVMAFHKKHKDPVAAVLLIFCSSVAYYWIAGATKEGKKLFAPTLLVWESIKVAQKHGCKWFDFVGVWDERLSSQNRQWLGFTKFKEGFGGKTLYYPIA